MTEQDLLNNGWEFVGTDTHRKFVYHKLFIEYRPNIDRWILTGEDNCILGNLGFRVDSEIELVMEAVAEYYGIYLDNLRYEEEQLKKEIQEAIDIHEKVKHKLNNRSKL